MRRRTIGSIVFVLMCGLLVVLPFWQLADWASTKQAKGDAVQLLYEVSDFQMELLGSTLNEAGGLKTTDQLNEWKRAAFAAQYTHERLAMAVGQDTLGKLDSLDTLLEWIMRAQIGGNRSLKQEEQKLLQEAGKKYTPIMEAYGKLMSSGGEVIGSVRGQLEDADGELSKLLKEKTK